MEKVLLHGLSLLMVAAVMAGCAKPGEIALKYGREAEVRGELDETRRLYSAAISSGNGEGLRCIAKWLMERDAATIFADNGKARGAAWILAAEEVSGQIRRFSAEAAVRGCPVAGVEEVLAGYAKSIMEAREALRSVKETARRAERARWSEARRASAVEQRNRLAAHERVLQTEIAGLEKQVAASSQELEDELERSRTTSARLEEESSRENLEGLVVMGAIFSGMDEYGARQMGMQLGMAYSLEKNWNDAESKARKNALSERKTLLEACLAGRQIELHHLKPLLTGAEAEVTRLKANAELP